MILIACVDDNMGMAFNCRRQSKDKTLCARILEKTAHSKLWMGPYSAKQFAEHPDQICVDEAFLDKAGVQEYAFTEIVAPGKYAPRVEEILLYRWNRSYPGDLQFDLPLEGYRLAETTEFAGNSHEKITEERYVK